MLVAILDTTSIIVSQIEHFEEQNCKILKALKYPEGSLVEAAVFSFLFVENTGHNYTKKSPSCQHQLPCTLGEQEDRMRSVAVIFIQIKYAETFCTYNVSIGALGDID